MKVDRGGGGRLRGVASGLLGIALLLAFAVAYGTATTSNAGAAGAGGRGFPATRASSRPGPRSSGPHRTRPPCRSPSRSSHAIPPRWRLRCRRSPIRVRPEYHHFLTPAQFAQRFGPTPATIAQVTANLQQQGLTVGTPSATGLSLPVSGTVAQVQSAFSTPISKYRLSSGKTGYANAAAPEVRRPVAPADRGHPRTRHPEPSAAVDERPAGEPGHCPCPNGGAAPAPGRPAPGQTTPAAGNCPQHRHGAGATTGALDAPQLAQAYSFGPLYSSSDYGAGSTVALVEMSGAGYSPSDINTFATCYGITLGERADHAKRLVGTGGASPGAGTAEAELDIETRSRWRRRRTSRSTRAARRTASTTSSARSSTTTPPRSSARAGRTGARPTSASPSRTRRTRSSRPPPRRGSRSSSPRGDQGAQGCNINGEDRGVDGLRTRWRRRWILRRARSTSPTRAATP